MTSSPGAACEACPLCALMTAMRETSPEALAHLATAVAEMAAAARLLLEGLESAARRMPSAGTTSAIERIPVS